jgi:hypothetical protein
MSESTDSSQPRKVGEVEQRATIVVGALVLILGLIGLALSFRAVSNEFRPEFGYASWAIPVGADVGIFAFSGLSILFALRDIPVRWVRFVPMALTGATVWFNVASATTWTARGAHALMPVLWVLAVEVCDGAIRHQMKLVKGKRMDKIRRSRWLLSPASTFRLWRRMRLDEITSFQKALDRDAARAAVTGRLRLHHGRMWRTKAPLAERIALRLQGRDPAGVSVSLQHHQDTASLLAGSVNQDAPEAVAETLPDALPEAAPVAEEIPAQPATAPLPEALPAPVAPARRSPASPASGKRQTAGVGSVRRDAPKRTESELVDMAEALEREALEASGGKRKASYRAAQEALSVRYADAKAALDAARERIAQTAIDTEPIVHLVPVAQVEVEYANGSVAA